MAERILAALAGEIPWSRRRTLRVPFLAVVAGMNAWKVIEDWEKHPDRYPFRDSEEAEETLLGALEEKLPEVSRLFPGVAFAYVRVECFGGVCLFDGFVARDGDVVFRQSSSHDGHCAILAAAGAPIADWFFAPFTRGWFEGAAPPEVVRRGIRGRIEGTIAGHGIELVGMALLADLRPPWKVWRMGETWFAAHGEEDVSLSLNFNPDGTIALGGRSHVGPEDAAGLLNAVYSSLASLGGEAGLELLELNGAVIRRWP